jgi:hypothetical protein
MALIGVVSTGCSSGPGAIAPPDVDPADLSEAILTHNDKDGDGNLSSSELANVPAVLERLADYDADRDGEVSLDELHAHMATIFDGKTGLMTAACRVTHNGKPLKGAVVHFVPLTYVENALPVASGVTLTNGMTLLSIRPEDLPANSPERPGLVRPGLYFVEVTHPEVDIPEQYNLKTTLGREVSPKVALAGAIELPLDF